MKKNYVPALEQALYDLFVSLGDYDLEEFEPDAGIYRNQPYELGEVPLAVAAKAINFRLQNGLAQQRLAQLHKAGIYTWRKTGLGKPSFLSLNIADHDKYFAACAKSRAEYLKNKPPMMPIDAGLVAQLKAFGSDVTAYGELERQLVAAGRAHELTAVWCAYMDARAKEAKRD